MLTGTGQKTLTNNIPTFLLTVLYTCFFDHKLAVNNAAETITCNHLFDYGVANHLHGPLDQAQASCSPLL